MNCLKDTWKEKQKNDKDIKKCKHESKFLISSTF